jgi:hypothetical protein
VSGTLNGVGAIPGKWRQEVDGAWMLNPLAEKLHEV